MNEAAGNRARADANLHRRLTGLGKIGIPVSHATGAANNRDNKSDKKIGSTITDQFHIETPTGFSVT
jgi:hypothetical protein